MYINSITWSSLSSAVVCSVTKMKSNGDHWECPLLLFLQPYERTPVWGKNPKGDGELSGRGFDMRRVGPKKPTWGNVCCWDLPVQNILLASHMNTQTNTLALLISSHARAHRHTHKHPPGLSSSALVSFAWGFPGSKDPFLILHQKQTGWRYRHLHLAINFVFSVALRWLQFCQNLMWNRNTHWMRQTQAPECRWHNSEPN